MKKKKKKKKRENIYIMMQMYCIWSDVFLIFEMVFQVIIVKKNVIDVINSVLSKLLDILFLSIYDVDVMKRSSLFCDFFVIIM